MSNRMGFFNIPNSNVCISERYIHHISQVMDERTCFLLSHRQLLFSSLLERNKMCLLEQLFYMVFQVSRSKWFLNEILASKSHESNNPIFVAKRAHDKNAQGARKDSYRADEIL